MYLLEHHGKELLAARGLSVPAGVFVGPHGRTIAAELPSGPWMVKAQVAAGGRGKAGAVQGAVSIADIARIVAELSGTTVSGKPIHGFRIEQRVPFTQEMYLSVSVDAAAAQIRVMVAAKGGVDVETIPPQNIHSAQGDPEDLPEVVATACAGLSEGVRHATHDAGQRLAAEFLAHEATLLEVNPLFLCPDGTWMVGDLKLVVDDDALVRQPILRALVEANAHVYPETARKLAHGFDYVEIDAEGEIGLITTGAGLSMKLIDEFKSQGRRPLNFCDIRSGQFRGDPARLIAVMQWIAARPSVRVVLVNIFAGITDLAEFARLLVAAAEQVPALRVPIVARMIGRNFDEAKQILAGAGLAVTVEPDLEAAVALTRDALSDDGARRG